MKERDAKAVERFRSMLRIKTISGDEQYRCEFERFLPSLRELYPLVFSAVECETVGERGILIRWRGNCPDKSPVVLMAHHDVVACEDEKWRYPPFGAEIHEGAVWARGSVDTKCIIAAVLEAMESLIAEGFRPRRDIYFVSGGDEEIFGGAMPAIVETLRSRGIRPWFVLDEGGAVLCELPMGIKRSFAMVGVAEKAYGSLRAKFSASGGESAMSRATKAASAVENAFLTPRLSKPVRDMLGAFAPYVKPVLRPVMKNLWLFAPAVLKVMSGNRDTSAMIRSTVTLGEIKANAEENTAEAIFKLRLNPGDCFEAVQEHVRKLLGDDVELSLEVKSPGAPVTAVDTAAFGYIKKTVEEVFDADTAPFVLDGGTDARHFACICPEVYRLGAFRMSTAMRGSVHRENENMPIISFLEGIAFYRFFLENLD